MVVDAESYEAVLRFCYLRDIVDAGGGCDAAVTSRIRIDWKALRDMVPSLTSWIPTLEMKEKIHKTCVRSSMIYSSQNSPPRKKILRRLDVRSLSQR